MNLETGALAGDRGKLDEFDLIASVFAPLTDGDERALGLLDDAAVLPQAAGRDTVITTDTCLLYTSPSPRDRTRSRMPSSA